MNALKASPKVPTGKGFNVKKLSMGLSCFFSLVFLLMAMMMFNYGRYLQSFPILGISLIFVPAFRNFLRNKFKQKITWQVFALTGFLLWGGMMATVLLFPADSIYKNEDFRQELDDLYNDKLAEWPTDFESVYVNTKYGRIHVIVSGPEDGFPVLLCHASAFGAWSWKYNVGELNKKYRTYAVDNIGEGGKNRMLAPYYIPVNGLEIAELYTDITEKLGVKKSHVIGASIGGYIATCYALHAPERVEKMVLLGAMGYGSILLGTITMTLAQGFPLNAIQKATFRWAYGDDDELERACGLWFRRYMKGLLPTPISPKSFVPDQLRSIRSATLAYFGTEDRMIGDKCAAKKLAENIPIIDIKIVNAGHMMGIEIADEVNRNIMEFFIK
ncbi:MAG: alpha/beta hydrolase [Candidatus Marinimicrobia bacterium]|nr:alpha/beta hydrolase [Candidatus Neomarinimicrobiota bacterium]